ncbi:carbohydrate ABC transporter permease [Spirochaeta dissipatitropha]
MSKLRHENISGYSFLALWLIGFILFTVFPLLYTFFLSFHDVQLTVQGWQTTWIGLENYISALLRNTQFVPGLIEFVIIETVYTTVILIISFILALILNQRLPFRLGFRLIFFLPVIILSGSVMIQLMESGTTQMVQYFERIFLIRMIDSYSSLLAAGLEMLLENFILILWFTGIPIILFLNILQKINPSVLEAARIDGANGWQILWKIIIPYVRPVALTAAIFTIVQIGLFPINPVYDLIRNASFNTASGLGIASTLSWLYSLVLLSLIGVVYLLLKQREDV